MERFLRQHQSGRYERSIRDLNQMLKRWTPKDGPPFDVEERAKRLRDGVCEFRAHEKRLKKQPRIFFFEDHDPSSAMPDWVVDVRGIRASIICTSAVLKTTTPEEEIERAIAAQGEYLAHKPEHLSFRKAWGVGP